MYKRNNYYFGPDEKRKLTCLAPQMIQDAQGLRNRTYVNHENIIHGSVRESLRMYNLHTLISSLSQK